MGKSAQHDPQTYQLRRVLRAISPLIRTRLLTRSDSTLEWVVVDGPRISTIAQTNSKMKNRTVPATTTRTGLTDGRLIVRSANLRRVHTRRRSMKFTIQLLIESADARPLSVPVQTIE